MKKTIDDLKVKGKKVLMRVDFNVPIKDGVIQSNTRIVEALPTIEKLLKEDAKIILFSHLGRVKSQADVDKNDLFPVSEELARLIKRPVNFVDSTRGKELEKAIALMKPKDIILVQNTRYEDLNEKAESGNNPELGKYWASLGDVFINDAFGTAHRNHASTCGIPANLKQNGIGYLMKKEMEALSQAVDNPKQPMVAIIGGAKVSDKIKALENLITKVDKMIIGGAMAYTFKKALGYTVGTSLVEDDFLDFAKGFMDQHGKKVLLPIDNACAKEFANEKPTFCGLNIPDGLQGLDIGPKTIEEFKKALKGAKTVVWNGPMGVAEFSNYANGTLEIAKAVAELGKSCYSVVGGGDSVAAVENLGLADKFSHISTGGGASLQVLQGEKLPALEIIQDKKK